MRYALRRVAGAVPLILGALTLIFFLVWALPGDFVDLYLGTGMSPEAMERLRVAYCLDCSPLLQYGHWIGSIVQGDFGESFVRRLPVRDVVLAALPNTLLLSTVGLLLAFAVGIPLGVLQAVRRGSRVDSGLTVVSLFVYSMPAFWLAIMLVLVFSLGASTWGWPIVLPASGVVSVDHAFMTPWGAALDRLRHLILPALSLGLILAAGVTRFVRASVGDALRQDYVVAARARGLPERTVIVRHALRNALLPVITLIGLYLPLLLSGTVFVEKVFAWPGMGNLVVDAIVTRDTPVVMAGSVLFVTVVVLGNLLADLLYAVADPRIRHDRA